MSEIYSPSDVQKLLGLDSSTLRKYAALLEEHGYHVDRNTRGHRVYLDKDVNTLRKLMEYNKQNGMTMDRSVEEVMTWLSEEYKTDTVTEISPLDSVNNQEIIQYCNHDELLERIEHLEQINVDLIKLLKEKAVREAYLEEKINQVLKYIERMEQMGMERMIVEETKKQIAASQQKKWWKWWK